MQMFYKFLGKGKNVLSKPNVLLGEGKCFGSECKSFVSEPKVSWGKSKDLQAYVKFYFYFLGQTFCKRAQSFLRESKSIAKQLTVFLGEGKIFVSECKFS